MAYTDIDDFKLFRNITGTGVVALIETLVAAVQQMIDNYTGRTFEAAADSTRYFTVGRDTEGSYLWFDEDIASITTVTNGDPDSTEVTSSEYTTFPRNETPYYGIKILRSAAKVWQYDEDHEDAISVLGKWAYSTTAPADIIQAAHLWIAHLYDRRLSEDGDLVIVPGTSVSISRCVPPSVRMILDSYRRF